MQKHLILDPLYGFIELSGEEAIVAYSPPVMRLANIKQLGFSYFKYPLATHTRWSHSIGVAYLMKKACQYINSNLNRAFFNADDVKVAGLIGLLHDLGHGPLSHSLGILMRSMFRYRRKYDVELTNEYVNNQLRKEYLRDYLKGMGLEDGKEDEGENLIDNIFGRRIGERVRGILSKDIDELDEKDRVIKDMIDSDADLDRIDYLARDSYFTIQGRTLNVEALLKNMILVRDDRGDRRFGYHRNACLYLESLLMLRNLLYAEVYEEENRAIADIMFSHAVYAHCHRQAEGSDELLRKYLKDFVKMPDCEALVYLRIFGDDYEKEIIRRLLLQKPYKVAYKISFYDMVKEEGNRDILKFVLKACRDWRFDFEKWRRFELDITNRMIGEAVRGGKWRGHYPAIFVYLNMRDEVLRALSSFVLEQDSLEQNIRVEAEHLLGELKRTIEIYLADRPEGNARRIDEILPYITYLDRSLLARTYLYVAYDDEYIEKENESEVVKAFKEEARSYS